MKKLKAKSYEQITFQFHTSNQQRRFVSHKGLARIFSLIFLRYRFHADPSKANS